MSLTIKYEGGYVKIFLIENPEYPIIARVFLSIADLSPLRTANGAKIFALPRLDRNRHKSPPKPRFTIISARKAEA